MKEIRETDKEMQNEFVKKAMGPVNTMLQDAQKAQAQFDVQQREHQAQQRREQRQEQEQRQLQEEAAEVTDNDTDVQSLDEEEKEPPEDEVIIDDADLLEVVELERKVANGEVVEIEQVVEVLDSSDLFRGLCSFDVPNKWSAEILVTPSSLLTA